MRLVLGLLVIIIVSCQSSPVRTLPIIGPIDFDQEDTIHHKLKPFSLTNQLGEIITLDSLKGKVHVAEFFFSSCPAVCPMMKSSMDMVMNKFKAHEEFRIVSYTVDPERDTVAHLKEYGDRLNIDPEKWYLLTGESYEIQRVSYRSYLQVNVKDSLSLNHSQQFVLVDKDLHIRGLYDGTDSVSVSMLIEDVELLLNKGNDRD